MNEQTEKQIENFTDKIFADIRELISNKGAIIENFIKTIYNVGYNDGRDNARSEKYDSGYKKGLEDAWKIASKIVKGYYDDLFSQYKEPVHAIRALSVFETITKIKEYERKQDNKLEQVDDKIKIGDEVIAPNGIHYIITGTNKNNDKLYLGIDMYGDCASVYYEEKELQKTGKYFPQMIEILKQMKGDKYENRE